MSALEVPEEAIEKAAIRVAGMFAGDEGQWRGYWNFARAALEAGAAAVVAADYDKTAAHLTKQCGVPNDEWDHGFQDGLKTAATGLQARASVLRGEGDPT